MDGWMDAGGGSNPASKNGRGQPLFLRAHGNRAALISDFGALFSTCVVYDAFDAAINALD